MMSVALTAFAYWASRSALAIHRMQQCWDQLQYNTIPQLYRLQYST